MNPALALDVGGTSIKAGLVTPNGQLLAQATHPTPQGGKALVATIKDLVPDLRERWSADMRVDDTGMILPTIGVAAPGVVDERSGMAVLSANLGWRDFPMRRALEDALGTDVVLCHDVRSGALAEARWGAGSVFSAEGATATSTGAQDILFVAVGTGISAGLVLGGRAWAGNGWAGEIGQYLLLDPAHHHSGAKPQYLPLEQLASAIAISRRFRQLAQQKGSERKRWPDTAQLFALAKDTQQGTQQGTMHFTEQERQLAELVIQDHFDLLGDALVHATAALGPIPVVIGGGIINEGPAYLERLAQACNRHRGVLPAPRLALARLGSWAQCLGVGAQVFDWTQAHPRRP